MRLKIVIGLVAEGIKYREFIRVADLPVMPERINVGLLTLCVKDANEPLTYYVSEEVYRLYWEVDITEKGGFATAADRYSVCAKWFRVAKFVEVWGDDDTENEEGKT